MQFKNSPYTADSYTYIVTVCDRHFIKGRFQKRKNYEKCHAFVTQCHSVSQSHMVKILLCLTDVSQTGIFAFNATFNLNC